MKLDTSEETRLVQEAAATWLIRLEEEGHTQECREEFVAWLYSSPRNLEEFLFAQAVWRRMDKVDPRHEIDLTQLVVDQDSVRPLQPTAMSVARRRLTRTAIAIAACVALAWLAISPIDDASRLYTTGTGEQQTVSLADGSLMHLNTRSKLEVSFDEHTREVRLLEGEALFVVQKDPARSFRVLVDDAVIEAVGTQFNVYRKGESARVTVLEGAVNVSLNDVTSRVSSGEEAELARGAISRQRSDVKRAIAWRNGRLDFRGEPLASVAAEFNRYRRVRIVVEGDEVRSQPINGVFDAADAEPFLKFLEDGGLLVHRSPTEIVIKARGT